MIRLAVDPSKPKPTHRTLPKRLLIIGVTVLAAAMLFLSVLSGTKPGPPLPNPNGYEDFLQAGELFTAHVQNVSAMPREALRELVSSNAEPLRLLRVGCNAAAPCRRKTP